MNFITSRTLMIITLVGSILFVGNFLVSSSSLDETDTTIKNKDNSGISQSFSKEVEELPEPNVVYAKRNDTPPKIYARNYALLDGETNYLLTSKDADTQVSIASTTKIMTALVAIETLPLDQVVNVSSKAARIEGSAMQLLTGEKITVKNLLYGLMLNSGNDAALALSEAAGTTDQFVQKMNEKAQLMGLRNTRFDDPAGLSTQSMSSARDLTILFDYALSNPTFRSIVQTPKQTIWSADNRYMHELKNSNRLIHPDEALYLPSTIGGKTGFTYEAGHCLVAAAEVNGRRYVTAVLFTLEDTKEASAKESRKLLNWAVQGQ